MDQQTVMVVIGALLAVSEALSLIPALKSNGVLQLVVNLLQTLCGKGKGI